MEKRLLLAFILMGAVLFLTPYFYNPEPPAQETAGEVAKEVAPPEESAEEIAAATPPETPPAIETTERQDAEPLENVAAESEQDFVIETGVYKIVFSNRGAVVKNWVLKDYVDSTGEPLELVNPFAQPQVGLYPFAVEFSGSKPDLDVNDALFAVEHEAGSAEIAFEFSDGTTHVTKSFRFRSDEYLFDFASEVKSGGKSLPHLLSWRGGFGDTSVLKAASKQHTLYYDITEDKLVVNDPDEAEDGPIDQSGKYSFAGLEDAYFAAVALPSSATPFGVRIFSDMLVPEGEEKGVAHAGAAIGGQGRNEFPMFVGPKDVDLLKDVDPKLQQLVDFGWFSILAKPLFLGMKWVHNNWVANYGWAIVLLTIGINTVLFPLKLTSLKSMKKMQALQPHVQELNEKYKGMSMRDPRKQKQNEELMALYQKHGVNPLGGCMPMVLQIPFFFAFYKVLSVAIELRGAEWLWVSDLSQAETYPIHFLPLLMVISQFAMQKLTPTTTTNPSQAKMMMMMPLMFGFFFWGVSSGLVLYWLTSNVVGAAQQLLINKIGEKPDIPLENSGDTKPKKKSRKR